MKKIVLSLVALGMLAVGAEARSNPFQGPQGEQGVQGEQGIQGRTGATGQDGLDGIDTDSSDLYTQLKQQRAASTALASVELNPDHEGWSVGAGVSPTRGEWAGAVGLMYAERIGGTDDSIQTIGYNVKAYKSEGGYEGVGVGITLGF